MKKLLLIIGILYLFNESRAQRIPRIKCTTIVTDAMLLEVDTTKPRGVSDNYHTWSNGQVLLIKFMPGGSTTLREKVIQYAREWEKYATKRS